MGYDGKYGKIITEFGEIPDDEPVMLFRGRDPLLPALIEAYYELCVEAGSPERHMAIVEETVPRIRAWQAVHPDRVKLPRSEGPAGVRYEQTRREQWEQFGE